MRFHPLVLAVLAVVVPVSATPAVGVRAGGAGTGATGDAAEGASRSPAAESTSAADRSRALDASGAFPAARAAAADTILRDLLAPLPVDPVGLDGRRVAVDRPGRPGAPWRARLGSLPEVRNPAVPGGRLPPGRASVRLGLKTLPPAWLEAPPVPGAGHRLAVGPGGWTARWGDALDPHLAPDALLRAAHAVYAAGAGGPGPGGAVGRPGIPGLPPDERAARVADPPAPRTDTTSMAELGAFVSDYADLGVRVQARSELGGDWTRFRPCLDQFQETCNPRLLPQLQPDLRFDVQVGGSILERIHVDVDFDQMREFEAANRINLRYEGGPDAIVQQMEVGDVTFTLPPSRYLTEGLPAGNFGFQARGQVGPVDFRTVWAEQKGDLSSRVFRLTGVGNQRRFVQEDTVVLDDADYASGQFFFLLDPEEIERYPHIDVLDLDIASAPSHLAPGIEPVQVYRFDADPVARQQVEGFIQAEATLERDGDSVTESGWFRYLIPGQDYFVHPSGLWIALRSPLSREEVLAVTYVTAAGDTVGDYNPERIYTQGGRPELRLLKASGANHQPGRPTWEMEMHQIYRASSSNDVEPASVEVTISLGELSAGRTFVRSPTGQDITFLQLLGLDRESPLDEVDAAAVFQPGRDIFQDQAPVQGTFIVFPTLEPFKRPPPQPSLRLSEEETAELLGDRANLRIYDNPDPFERANGGLFRLTIPFRRQSEGVISSFSLGALGIRDGSERIFLGDRQLVRGVDYEIDYDVGQVRLLEAEALFAGTQDDAVRATWEQKQIFRTAPVSVFGFQGSTQLGRFGDLNLIGLYRAEKTLVNRPNLGVEPGAVGLLGLSGDISTGAGWLDGFLDRIPGLRFSGTSAFSVDGEAALSLPDPNTRGAVFLDDFDAPNARRLSLLSHDWTRGSAPATIAGAEEFLPTNPDASTVGEMVWQHTWITEGTAGDSVGIHEGFFPREEIDQQIRVAGSSVREPGLRLTLDELPVGEPGWSSITTTLSRTGADLTRSEFLEVYVAGGSGQAALVIDVGRVSEDAMFVAPDGSTGGVVNGIPWGLGVLDQEADPARGEIWGAEADERGVWEEECRAEPGQVYRLGDPRAVCTRNNGRQDSEDLDGDGNLDVQEKHLRYVVDLTGSSPYLARTRSETNTSFRLYRIPLRDMRAMEIGGEFTEGDFRAVKHLRVTLAADRSQSVTLARMQIIGSRWVTRRQDGVLRGIVGDTAAFSGRVEVASVSRLTEGDSYRSPPGVLEELADPTSQFGAQGLEFNEKSLSVSFEDVMPGDRAEVYNRFPQRPRNFLRYREARVWVTARDGDLGLDDPHWFFYKVGTDADNFYLFRTRLPAPSGGVEQSDWLPEVVVDFGEWIELRRRAEEALIVNPRVPGDPPVMLWSQDSTYAVVLRDRGRAPDLANVREMAMGVWNLGDRAIQGEVWIDELRLSRPVTDGGVAGFVDMSLVAADVFEARAVYSGRGAFFHQLDENPTHQTDRVLNVSSRLNLERFTPAEWGVALPLRVTHDRSAQDPVFLSDSDVRADRIQGLRETGIQRTRVSVGFRKRTPSANPIVSALLDGLNADVGWFRTEASTVTTRLRSSGVDTRLDYSRRLDRRTVGVVPGFLEGIVRALLPSFLEDEVVDAEVRWVPERFSMGTGWRRHDNQIFRFQQIAHRPQDSLATPTSAPRESMETAAEVAFRPFDALSAALTFLSVRDLLEPREAVADPTLHRPLQEARSSLAGVDLGWETNRVIRTNFGFRPSFVPWLRHQVDVTTHYLSDRNASLVERVATGPLPGDSVTLLQRNASGDRSLRALVSWDVAAMGRALSRPPPDADSGPADPADPSDPAGGGAGAAGAEEPAEPAGAEASPGPPFPVRLLERVQPVVLNYDDGLTSRFNRDPIDPGLGYQLGLGGLDRFRVIDGDTAVAVTDRGSWRVGSGLLLPGGLDLGVAYAEGQVMTLDARSDRSVSTRTWPDVSLGGEIPGGIPGTPVDQLSFSVGVQEDLREIRFGTASQQLRTDERVRMPWELRLGWAGATSLLYSGELEAGDGLDPTGETERDAHTHRLSLSSSFVPPGALAARFDRPVRLSLVLTYGSETECRTAAFRTDCVAFLDRINRALSMTLGTGMQGFEVGLQASYNDRQSFVGQRQGATQFQLGLFGQFLFEAGRSGAMIPR